MNVTVLQKEEIHRVRHFSLTVALDDNGKHYELRVIVIENYDTRANTYFYEVESFSWLSGSEGADIYGLQKRLEGYLIDNAEDILS